MNIGDLVKEKNVLFLDPKDRNDAINRLSEQCRVCGSLSDISKFKNALLERESLMSTGIGLGVAVPHAKLPFIDHFFIIIGILANPVEWNSLDGKPVRIVFLIGGPDSEQKTYLTLLSKLMLVVKNPALRENLLNAKNAADVVRPFLEI